MTNRKNRLKLESLVIILILTKEAELKFYFLIPYILMNKAINVETFFLKLRVMDCVNRCSNIAIWLLPRKKHLLEKKFNENSQKLPHFLYSKILLYLLTTSAVSEHALLELFLTLKGLMKRLVGISN